MRNSFTQDPTVLSLRVVRCQVESLPLRRGVAVAQLLLDVEELEVRRHKVDVHGLRLHHRLQSRAHKQQLYLHSQNIAPPIEPAQIRAHAPQAMLWWGSNVINIQVVARCARCEITV
jgi:hypothetical protein